MAGFLIVNQMILKLLLAVLLHFGRVRKYLKFLKEEKTFQDVFDSRQGMASSDDARFVRLHWETAITKFSKFNLNKNGIPMIKVVSLENGMEIIHI